MTATIQFLSWMRRGLVRSLASPADATGAPTAALATVQAAVTVGTTEVTRDVRVRGPGSVIGLAPEQIVRRVPPPGARDAEANFFPAVDLLSPDLPWLFTPASASTEDRLMPWLVLVVVEQRDGVTLASRPGAPLEVLAVDDARRELPSLADAWAWAHAQASVEIETTVEAAFAASPEAFVARLVCPRRLATGTSYIACVVPSFEPGRLAGLGESVAADAPITPAWTDATVELELPVYASWTFTTSAEPADFEELVKRLRARLLGEIGVHGLDIGEPGTSRLPQAPGTIVDFRGAIVGDAPAAVWDPVHQSEFRTALREMVDAPLARDPDPSPYDARRDDPVIAPPSYGALATGGGALPADGEWRAEANLDPRLRSAAGLGAEVVRRNQEQLAAEIVDQVAALRQVNRTLGRARLALEVGNRLKARVDALDDGALLQLTRPVHDRIKTGAMTTLSGRIAESSMPNGVVSGAFRRRVRSTTIARAVSAAGIISPLSPKLTRAFIANPTSMLEFARFTVPFGTVYVDATEQTSTSSPVVARLRSIDIDEAVGLGAGGAVVVTPTSHAASARTGLSTEGRTISAHGRVLSTTVAVAPVLVSPTPIAIDIGGDGALPLEDAADVVRQNVDPAELMFRRVRSLITAPATAWTSAVPEAMTAVPQLAQPAYELLAHIDPELLCPGVSALPADTVGLANVNAAFVEAFLLGVNHELARELVWREVPIDPSDTWMRTFWDPVTAATADIEPIATWSAGPLGSHAPATAPDPARMLVLVVKSDLLRRYPNTLVYATRAAWTRASSDAAWERVETTETKHPLFVGALGRDVIFLGFQFDAADIDREVAGSANHGDHAPGWFFVFEQPPTEPRFGLDVGDPADAGAKPSKWKNASWFHALGDASSTATHVPLSPLGALRRKYDDVGGNTWSETWAKDAAAMARVTLQRPVRMLVHADQMIRVEESES